MKLRGPGDLFGIRQSGDMQFVLGDVYQDASLLQCAGDWADRILAEDDALDAPEHALLREYLEQAQINEVDFRTI
jgi:ATP-dependent DNA helicase RecG